MNECCTGLEADDGAGAFATVGVLGHYWRALGLSTRNNSLTYGFSIAMGGTFAILSRLAHGASVADAFVFVVGAGLPFARLNPVVTRGFRRRVEREPPMVIAVGTSFGVVPASVAVGAAGLVAWPLDDSSAWLLGSFAATSAYLLTAAFEVASGRGVHRLAGTENLEAR